MFIKCGYTTVRATGALMRQILIMLLSLSSSTVSAAGLWRTLYSHFDCCSLDTEVEVQVGILSVPQVQASV
jgi:hypothetical protein